MSTNPILEQLRDVLQSAREQHDKLLERRDQEDATNYVRKRLCWEHRAGEVRQIIDEIEKVIQEPSAWLHPHQAERDRLYTLVAEAMTIRTYGEHAPGGTENWADWDVKAEAELRGAEGLLGDEEAESTVKILAERNALRVEVQRWCEAAIKIKWVLAGVVNEGSVGPRLKSEQEIREQVAGEILAAQGADSRFPDGWASHQDRDHAAAIARGTAEVTR
jgi:hypothetical protein